MRIFDLSNYDLSDSSDSLLSRFKNTIDESQKPKYVIANNNTLAYMKQAENGLFVYDITDSENPALIGSVNGTEFKSIELIDNKLFAIEGQVLKIYDISANLELISTIENDSNGSSMISPSYLEIKSDKLFVGGNGKLYTFDISGQSAIALNTQNVSANVLDIEVHQGNIYVLGSNSIEILSLSYSPPVFSAVNNENNSIITLDFSENVYSSSSGNGDLNADDFTVSLIDSDGGLTLTSYSVSKISDSQYAFTVEFNGVISGNESITINPQNDEDGNYSIYSALGVPMSTNQTNNTVDLIGPTYITSTSISEGNLVTVKFSEDVYATINSEGDLVAENFSLVLSATQLASVDSTPLQFPKIHRVSGFYQLI